MFRSRNHWGQLRNEVSCAINRVQHINKSSWRIVHKSIQIRFKSHFCLGNIHVLRKHKRGGEGGQPNAYVCLRNHNLEKNAE